MKRTSIILAAIAGILLDASTAQAIVSVPDAGATAGLLAIGTLGLLAFRRK